MISALSIATALAAAAAPAPAANPKMGQSQLVTAIQNCQAVKDNAARLACYDQAASALVTATTRGDVAIVDRTQVKQVRRSLFGFSLPSFPFFSGSKNRDADDEPKELNTTLASFQPIANGFIRFGLAEPQSTWESTEPSDIFAPKIGAKVLITHGALGSYWAEIGAYRAVKVRRIR
ncbi:MAG TPA: hypothetical protein VFY95_09235 [Sphingomicrobium sp.]